MSDRSHSAILSRRLPESFSIARVFPALSKRRGCLWLDSASNSAEQNGLPSGKLSRYSFITCDPIATLRAVPGDDNPWDTLSEWCSRLGSSLDPELPPFQGGIAGLIGYEAATWLEDVGVAANNDLPTPAIALGVYDWTIAVDHLKNQAWIIVRNLDEQSSRKDLQQRLDEVESWLNVEPTALMSSQASSLAARHEAGFSTDHHGITSNFQSGEFRAAVADIVGRIRRGDSFQVNLAQRLVHSMDLSSPELYQRLRRVNPAPFAAYFDGGDFQVLSSSPEGFLQLRNSHVETRPIKGTVSRSGEPESDKRLATQLSASKKDRAENIMIVDLMRNDLSRVCKDETVQVTQLCELEAYQYVQHLVSVVEGDLRDNENAVSLLKACFPGGSVTGAPKIEAMKTIAELEPNPRGPYCGSIGYISSPETADFNILIRTITATGGQWQIPVGGGITARSVPESEEIETWTKAEGMIRAIIAADD
ncbi:Aminodeoxychorismate synthase component 1 [Rubripirellula amarantea]|uniref:Aminodeoxychorismate synthase component 1 n=1 Tax=Rubripirellula amarantea TaxID=2527999 RepID=A0A5C5WUY5_9BACT|nr:anthranilate synthase component I family protein [Rubripirellula amarantea]TWT54557.1 Aminodeoxychorismate synthase component 1 [Rubripirellula amarantea]